MNDREILKGLDVLDWYRRCLEDVQDGRSVRGFDEAKVGYDVWFEKLTTYFS